jgi:hypothetical protein
MTGRGRVAICSVSPVLLSAEFKRLKDKCHSLMNSPGYS